MGDQKLSNNQKIEIVFKDASKEALDFSPHSVLNFALQNKFKIVAAMAWFKSGKASKEMIELCQSISWEGYAFEMFELFLESKQIKCTDCNNLHYFKKDDPQLLEFCEYCGS